MYLGRHGTPDSVGRYNKFLARLTSAAVATPRDRRGLRELDILIDSYLQHAERHYARRYGRPVFGSDGGQKFKHDGTPLLVSSEYHSMLCALRPLGDLFGDVLACDFGPRALVEFRDSLVASGYTRTGINDTISRIKKFFRWCCQQELCQPALYSELQSVGGLYRGQGNVVESDPIIPAKMESVLAVLPFLPPVVSMMARVQYLCGMRPGEVCIMRPCDIDRSGGVWIYHPQRHKTEWRGFSQFKAITKQAREIIEPILPTIGGSEYVFKPADSFAWSLVERAANRPTRKTTLYMSEQRRVEREKRLAKRRVKQRQPGDCYTTDSYRRSIARGIGKATRAGVAVESFTPNQLRHAILSDVSRILGQQQAQRFGGHENLKTTEIYTGLQLAELIEIAGRLDTNAEFSTLAKKLVAQDQR